MNDENKNPFAMPDGSPQDGKEFEFLDWAASREKERLAKLPVEEKRKILELRSHLADKMQSSFD